ncbi:hypothetical protein CTI12_AA174420 [Artemisia annua]|uniref:Retrovirus-related Pol polyprotein from transposon TNT 1-94-like beta-barrel domain-containing protein n=1 Tax=Artemisia annua TaxID=35608 RepID=A0A2U1PB06_ARTAN|nr:hypothetical protein CTI12_AA174420 [Artemisia annua]
MVCDAADMVLYWYGFYDSFLSIVAYGYITFDLICCWYFVFRGVLFAGTADMKHARDPVWHLDSGCSKSMTGVKQYLHKYVEEPGPKVVFGDNSSAPTEGYGSVNCNGIVFTRIAYVNGLKYNLISVSQLCDAKYIV